MVTVRAYRAGDQEAVVALWWDSWHSIRPGLRHPQPFSAWLARWETEIATGQVVVVAADDGVVVGFAAADVAAGVLTQIFVAPGRQRRGIGRELLDWARRRMPEGFRLQTLVDNVGSQAFYERHGLAAVGGAAINPVNSMATREYRWSPPTRSQARTPRDAQEEVVDADRALHREGHDHARP